MCGGAILAEIIRIPPARRVTADNPWPQGWVEAGDFEAALPEFDEDSASPVALPRFRRYGLSAFEVIHIPPFRTMRSDLIAMFPTTEEEEPHAGMPARASDSVSRELFDALCFDGVAYEALESLFSADAVQQSNAEAAARLRTFADRSCRLLQHRRLRVPRQHLQRGRRAEQRPRRRGLLH